MASLWQRDPTLLLLPNIPKPLHGMNPRSVLGGKWWDQERKAAYKSTNYHCESCGVHKDNAKFRKVVEGHEVYDTDYVNGKLTYLRTVPLCSLCHEYVHDGRLLSLLEQGKITRSHYSSVIQHGDRLLAEAGLRKPSHLERDALIFKNIEEGRVAFWGDWRLVIDLSPYKTKVLNNRRDKISPRTTTYIGRGSLYGNPFVIGTDGDRDSVCDQYEKEVLPTLNLLPLFGRNVVCYCSPARCHGDSIISRLYRPTEFKPLYKTHQEWLEAHAAR